MVALSFCSTVALSIICTANGFSENTKTRVGLQSVLFLLKSVVELLMVKVILDVVGSSRVYEYIPKHSMELDSTVHHKCFAANS